MISNVCVSFLTIIIRKCWDAFHIASPKQSPPHYITRVGTPLVAISTLIFTSAMAICVCNVFKHRLKRYRLRCSSSKSENLRSILRPPKPNLGNLKTGLPPFNPRKFSSSDILFVNDCSNFLKNKKDYLPEMNDLNSPLRQNYGNPHKDNNIILSNVEQVQSSSLVKPKFTLTDEDSLPKRSTCPDNFDTLINSLTVLKNQKRNKTRNSPDCGFGKHNKNMDDCLIHFKKPKEEFDESSDEDVNHDEYWSNSKKKHPQDYFEDSSDSSNGSASLRNLKLDQIQIGRKKSLENNKNPCLKFLTEVNCPDEYKDDYSKNLETKNEKRKKSTIKKDLDLSIIELSDRDSYDNESIKFLDPKYCEDRKQKRRSCRCYRCGNKKRNSTKSEDELACIKNLRGRYHESTDDNDGVASNETNQLNSTTPRVKKLLCKKTKRGRPYGKSKS